ncbi:hypothetical protein [Shewanella baltica]|nr:hypothetical protein [Shewanella baltica]
MPSVGPVIAGSEAKSPTEGNAQGHQWYLDDIAPQQPIDTQSK